MTPTAATPDQIAEIQLQKKRATQTMVGIFDAEGRHREVPRVDTPQIDVGTPATIPVEALAERFPLGGPALSETEALRVVCTTSELDPAVWNTAKIYRWAKIRLGELRAHGHIIRDSNWNYVRLSTPRPSQEFTSITEGLPGGAFKQAQDAELATLRALIQDCIRPLVEKVQALEQARG